MKYLIIYLFTITSVLAGLPLTTIKGQAETTKPTTFNFEVPENQATTTGSGTRLIETGNDNVIKDPDLEGNSLQWVTYADATGAAPVDGTGGTANVTVAYTTTNPLKGKKSMLFTKDAVNRQGQGTSLDFTIPDINKGKVNSIKLAYSIESGTYATGDLSIWVINVDPASATNGRVIQPSAYTIEKSGLKELKFLEFQSDIDSNLYRLVVHVTSTSASAYTLKFDSFSVGLGPKVYGSVTTDWELVTSGASVNWTNATLTLYKRRVGDSVEYQGKVSITGTPVGGALAITVPHSVESLSATYVDYSNPSYWLDSGGTDYAATVGYTSSNVLNVYYFNAATPLRGYSAITPTAPFTAASGDELKFRVSAKKVQGWSTTQQLSQDADTRVVAARYSLSSSQSIPDNSSTVIVWNSIANGGFDTHSAMNTSNGRYYAKVSGYYSFNVGFGTNSDISIASGNRSIIYYRVNSNFSRQLSWSSYSVSGTERISENGGASAYLNAGDYIEFLALMDFGSPSYNIDSSGGGITYLSINRISGPSQIAASESVTAVYTSSSGQSIPNNTETIINFATKEVDSHNAVTIGASWIFTAPFSGQYLVSSNVSFLVNGTGGRELYIYQNSTRKFTDAIMPSIALHIPLKGSIIIKLLAGETINVRAFQNSGGALVLLSNADRNTVSITRVGNY